MARVGLVAAMLVTLGLGLGGQRSAAQAATDLPETAALVPEDALFFLAVDLDLAAEHWAVADDLLARAGAPGALEQLRSTILDATALATPTAGADDDPLFGGELGVVLTDLPEFFAQAFEASATGDASPVATPDLSDLVNQPGPTFLLEPGDPDAAWELIQSQLGKAAEAADVEVGETTYRDVAIRTVDAESGPDAAVARLDDVIVAAFKSADLEPIIDTAEDDGPTLGDFASMAEVRAELNPELLVFGFGNSQALIDALGPAFQQSQDRSAEVNEVFGIATPIPQVDPGEVNVGLGIWAEETGLRSDIVNVREGGEPYPIVVAPAESERDAQVPSDTLLFANAFDLGPTGVLSASVGFQVALLLNQGALDGTPLATTTANLEPVTPEYVEAQFAQAAEELGFDLRDDLLNRLVGEHVFSFAVQPAIFTGNIDEGLTALFASDLDDPATVAESVQRVARRLERDVESADVSTRAVGGDTVYILSDPNVPDDPALEFGVVDDQLLIGLGDGIDAFLAGPNESLADDERYQRVMATLPTEHQGSLYVNVGQIIGLVQVVAGLTGGGLAPDATPVSGPGASPEPFPTTSAVEAFASVISVDDNVQRISSMLYVGDR